MSHQIIDRTVHDLGDELQKLSHHVHALAEPGFEETESVAVLAEFLGHHGHAAQIGCYGLDTALESRFGTDGPMVAILAEYDALPGIGHACGHNVIAASSLGAYLATAEALRASGIDGSVVLLGTPAEENGTGKEIMARHGAFEGVDAALMVHPTGGNDVVDARSLGLREVEIVFHGSASHASATPHLGRNALDAAVAAYQGVNALRPELLGDDRVHGIITDGGDRPNVVPERAALHFYVRSATPEQLHHLSQRLDQIVQGAAIMTDTRAEVLWDRNPACVPMQHSRPLGERFAHWLGATDRAVPLGERPQEPMGSTDAGNVSVRIPTIHPMVSIAGPEVTIHTEEFARRANGRAADRTIIDAARALGHTALDYLTSEELRRAAAADHAAHRSQAIATFLSL